MKDLGILSYFLGIEFYMSKECLFPGQKEYAIDTLKRFKMYVCNAVLAPAEAGLKMKKDGKEDLVDATQYRGIVG